MRDYINSLTFADNLAYAISVAIERKSKGILHIAGSERISRSEFARKIAQKFHLDERLLVPVEMRDLNWVARRPRDSSLAVGKAEKELGIEVVRSRPRPRRDGEVPAMKGVILHGGAGTRLRPLTHTGPKQLIPIANKPMSLYAIEALREAGITDIAIVLGSLAPEKVKEYYGDGSGFGVTVTYVHQGEPKGIAHAVGLTERFVGDKPFVVFLADNILKGGIQEMVDDFENSQAAAEIALCHVRNPQSFGIADVKNGKIVRLVEKPKDPPTDLALVGIYLFRKQVFDAIRRLKPSWRNELEITDAIQTLLDDGLQVRHRLVKGWWKDTGRPEDVLEANQLVLSDLSPFNKGRVEQDVKISGIVCIDEGTTVHSGTTLRGPLIVGKGCEIGPDAYVGPYTAVGDNTIIRGAEVENTIIVGECKIECKRRIVDSLIGRNTEISDSANSLPRGSRFIIGENTLVCV